MKQPKMPKVKAVPIAKAMPKGMDKAAPKMPKMGKMASAKKGMTPAIAKRRGKC